MKTEEDEAFDEITRKQGHWGGGFMAKRAMAADKFQQPAPNKKRPLESDYASHVAYTRALEMYCDTLEQPAQKAVANSFEEYCKTLPPLWNTHISRTYAEQFFRAGQTAQPAQEPVATKNNDGVTLHLGWDDLPVGTKLYTTPPKREWVGLTDEEIDAIYWQHENHCGEYKVSIWPYERAIEAKLKEKNL